MKDISQKIKQITRKYFFPLILIGTLSLASCGKFDRGTYQIGNSKVNYKISKWSGNQSITEIQRDGDTLQYEGQETFAKYSLKKFELNGEKYSRENNDYYQKIWNAAEKRLNYLIPKLDSILFLKYENEKNEKIKSIESN